MTSRATVASRSHPRAHQVFVVDDNPGAAEKLARLSVRAAALLRPAKVLGTVLQELDLELFVGFRRSQQDRREAELITFVPQDVRRSFSEPIIILDDQDGSVTGRRHGRRATEPSGRPSVNGLPMRQKCGPQPSSPAPASHS